MTSPGGTGRLTVHPVPGEGAEDVLVLTSGPEEGSVVTGTTDGSLWCVSHDGRRLRQVANTGGHPLGIEEHPDGRLVVCDADRGLLRVDLATGAVEVAADSHEGRPLRVCNNAAVATDGTVYFSDSSQVHDLDRWHHDLVHQTRSGRLLRLAPDGTVSVLLDGLAFANGVALSPEEDFVCVAETGARTLVRLWLTGRRAGLRDYLAMGLPGYPDNLSQGSDGLLWVALASPTDAVLERLQAAPQKLRRLALRTPERLQPGPRRSVRVRAYDTEGTLVHDLDLDAAAHGVSYHAVTGVREHAGRVWMGSFAEPAIAVWDR
ncbi:SMP-30/gluconolactonase/LRE family protein [Nocardioides nanhaiensis]|uniref:SMP-30/gluconolactonase/LRE family protein n=1 Tax=Nocardioides nanhaiensis TaxID=1476871 RepID=A0ABP8WH11_9ACTN